MVSAEGEMVSGTCEKIGFANFRTTYFHQLTLRVTDGNSILSHVPGTVFIFSVLSHSWNLLSGSCHLMN